MNNKKINTLFKFFARDVFDWKNLTFFFLSLNMCEKKK